MTATSTFRAGPGRGIDSAAPACAAVPARASSEESCPAPGAASAADSRRPPLTYRRPGAARRARYATIDPAVGLHCRPATRRPSTATSPTSPTTGFAVERLRLRHAVLRRNAGRSGSSRTRRRSAVLIVDTHALPPTGTTTCSTTARRATASTPDRGRDQGSRQSQSPAVGLGAEYFCSRRPGSRSCFDATVAQGGCYDPFSFPGFCAYHSSTTTSPSACCANQPYADLAGALPGSRPTATRRLGHQRGEPRAQRDDHRPAGTGG